MNAVGIARNMLWHVPRPRFARITRFARAQNRLSPILSSLERLAVRPTKWSGGPFRATNGFVHRSGTAIPAVLCLLKEHPCVSRYGGAGGIRTLDTALQPYNGLAN